MRLLVCQEIAARRRLDDRFPEPCAVGCYPQRHSHKVVVEKRHDNVKRTIETLSEQGVIVRPQIEDEPGTDTFGRPRVTQVYRFSGERGKRGKRGKRDSIIVVVQLCPGFTARFVDRWQELEAKAAAPAPPNFAAPVAAARAWAEQYEARMLAEKTKGRRSPYATSL